MHRRNQLSAWLLSMIILIILVAIWGFVLTRLQQERLGEIDRTIKEGHNLAHTFSEHALRTTKGVSQILSFLKTEYESKAGTEALVEYLDDVSMAQSDLFNLLSIIDENGDVVYSSQPPVQPVNSGDREFFLYHRDNSNADLYIGTPTLGRVTGKWYIPMSKRINKRDGSFDGVVLASVNPEYFTGFYNQVNLGEEGSVLLADMQGNVLAGFLSGSEDLFGKNLKNSPVYDFLSEQDGGYYISPSVLDGVTRIRCYQKVQGSPLFVMVGFGMDEILAGYTSQRNLILALGAIFTSFIIAFVLVYIRWERQRTKGEVDTLRLNAELEERVSERTARLSNMLGELETISYAISHDVRSPLRAIAGYSQIIAEDYGARLGEDALHYLERIRLASQRMSALIDGLLSISQVARSHLWLEDVNLSELAQKVFASLTGTDPERQVEFRVNSETIMVKADPYMIETVLFHLIGNAYKFTLNNPRAKIEFGQKTSSEAPQPYFVRDNGIGFNPDFAGKIFEPFQRLDGESELEGMGIGLAIARSIIRRHEGEIWAEGEPGQGAVFYFTLG